MLYYCTRVDISNVLPLRFGVSNVYRTIDTIVNKTGSTGQQNTSMLFFPPLSMANNQPAVLIM